MDPISMILMAIRGISVLTSNPAMGGGANIRLTEASELLSMLGSLVEQGSEAKGELKAFTESIGVMVEQNRAPNASEWEALRARSDAAHASIQAAAAAATAEEPTPIDIKKKVSKKTPIVEQPE